MISTCSDFTDEINVMWGMSYFGITVAADLMALKLFLCNIIVVVNVL